MEIENVPATMNRKRRWYRFSVRGLLVLVLVVGLWLGWPARRARLQREAVAAVLKHHGWVWYDYEFIPRPVDAVRPLNVTTTVWGTLLPEGRQPWAPQWLRRALGDEYFQEVVSISIQQNFDDQAAGLRELSAKEIDEILAEVSSQGGVRTLYVDRTTNVGMFYVNQLKGLEELLIREADEVTDEGFARLRDLKKLRSLTIHSSKMTDEDFRHLSGLTGIEVLTVQGYSFTDQALSHLRRMTELKQLWIRSDHSLISDEGMTILAGLKNLKRLELRGTNVTDQGLETLRGLTKLNSIWIGGSQITDGGREQFKASMPNLKTIRIH